MMSRMVGDEAKSRARTASRSPAALAICHRARARRRRWCVAAKRNDPEPTLLERSRCGCPLRRRPTAGGSRRSARRPRAFARAAASLILRARLREASASRPVASTTTSPEARSSAASGTSRDDADDSLALLTKPLDLPRLAALRRRARRRDRARSDRCPRAGHETRRGALDARRWRT